MKHKQKSSFYKFLMYVAVILLLNLVGATLFVRCDLTGDRLYSISGISKKVVSTLSEPLTIHVFFSRNLPAPHNNTERYVEDLLKEYAIAANHFFNYRFHNVSAEDEEAAQAVNENKLMANNYGIYPVQIQKIEKDEVKFQKAYMGMALIYGDMVERIPTITSTEGLEYKITTMIQKMNNKISALLRLPEKIEIKLVLSSSLNVVAPYIQVSGLADLPAKFEALVKKLNEKNYGKLAFTAHDPTADPAVLSGMDRTNLFQLQWDGQTDRQGREIVAGSGVAGIVMQNTRKSFSIPLIRVLRLPLIGDQYQLETMETMEKAISDGIENMLDINEKIAYLADFGTPPLQGGMAAANQPQEQSLQNFNSLVSASYSLQPVVLKDEKIPANLNCLIIAGPKEEFSDYALFQIDQFLMQGKSLAILLDSFNEIIPNRSQSYYNSSQGPLYLPLNTGLEKLLAHYGIRSRKSFVLDENCYKQRLDPEFGGGEQPIYFAPLIAPPYIDDHPDFMKNIERLIMLKISPLEIDQARIKEFGLNARMLFSSSNKGWEMSGQINLNPYFIQKPPSGDQQKVYPLAYILSGDLPSYFAGKPIPEKPLKAENTDPGAVKPETASLNPGQAEPAVQAGVTSKQAIDLSKIKSTGTVITKSKAGKIFLIGTSEILKNNLLDAAGESPNALFLMNLLDFLNNREDVAVMRSKRQRLNLMGETKGGTKTLVKTFNIVGLPILVVLAGIFIWIKRKNRQKRIQMLFRK
ncbi:MAG: Gldg family protein [Candidatus Aminicenantes bacterium]|nr:Gldg family protein [Candidatus Aminicenantes bacterium]